MEYIVLKVHVYLVVSGSNHCLLWYYLCFLVLNPMCTKTSFSNARMKLGGCFVIHLSSHLYKHSLIKIRRSHEYHIYTIGTHVPEKWCLIESGLFLDDRVMFFLVTDRSDHACTAASVILFIITSWSLSNAIEPKWSESIRRARLMTHLSNYFHWVNYICIQEISYHVENFPSVFRVNRFLKKAIPPYTNTYLRRQLL